jgi:hypothetical protein
MGFSNAMTPYITPYAPTGYGSGENSWLIVDAQDQILAWGAENARQNAALIQPRIPSAGPITTMVPYSLSRADLDKLLGNYKSGTNGTVPSIVPITPVLTIPAAPLVTPTGGDLHTSDGTSISLLFSRAMDKFRTNPQVPITSQVTVIVTPSPSPTPSGGNADQGTGISLAAFNLQGKYVRISNTGVSPVVMTGWKITNRQGNSLTFIDFPLGGGSTFTYVIDPSSTLTVYFGKDGVMTSTELYYPGGGNFWNAQGDTASLYNSQGRLIGSITA